VATLVCTHIFPDSVPSSRHQNWQEKHAEHAWNPVDEDHLLFPCSSKLPISHKHTEVLKNYSCLPTSFQPNNITSTYQKSMSDRTATDIVATPSLDIVNRRTFFKQRHAISAGEIAFFVCPVPGCKRDFGPAAQLVDLYSHLDEPVHWDYFDTHGVQCVTRCGRGYTPM
jgi:hypothetical protein